jgi:predicted NBD/HSP70 family sugar kinase
MDHFAGLDVSVKETSVCIVDDTGRIVREVKVASEPEAQTPSNDHEVLMAQGKSAPVACRDAGISKKN